MSYALITGASSGIGREMALLLSKKGYSLIIVARREALLQSLKIECEQYPGVKVLVLTLDLSLGSDREKLFTLSKDIDIDIVINNAGFGHLSAFDVSTFEKDQGMIDLNMIALHHIFKHFYIRLKHKKAHIMNVASIAAFMPGPHMSTYYASKAYVLSLTRAVRYEAKKMKYSIQVSALCPGPVSTEFQDVAQAKILAKAMPAKKCATHALRGMFRNKGLIIPGFTEKVMHVLSKIMPTSWILPAVYTIQKSKNKE